MAIDAAVREAARVLVPGTTTELIRLDHVLHRLSGTLWRTHTHNCDSPSSLHLSSPVAALHSFLILDNPRAIIGAARSAAHTVAAKLTSEESPDGACPKPVLGVFCAMIDCIGLRHRLLVTLFETMAISTAYVPVCTVPRLFWLWKNCSAELT